MNFINNIRIQYGQGLVKKYRKWENSTQKLAHHRNALVFNLRCKKEDVTPKFLRLKSNLPPTKNTKDILKQAERRLIRENIRIETNRIQKWKAQVEEDKNIFVRGLTPEQDDIILREALATINRKSEVAHAHSK